MLEHDIKIYAVHDSSTQITYSIMCLKCEYKVSVTHTITAVGHRIDSIEKLFRDWDHTVPQDCNEAQSLKLVSEIHER